MCQASRPISCLVCIFHIGQQSVFNRIKTTTFLGQIIMLNKVVNLLNKDEITSYTLFMNIFVYFSEIAVSYTE